MIVGLASVVSLIPGVFMFQTAAEALALVNYGASAAPATLADFLHNAATAAVVLLAMASGLIIPKMCFDGFTHAAAPSGH